MKRLETFGIYQRFIVLWHRHDKNMGQHDEFRTLPSFLQLFIVDQRIATPIIVVERTQAPGMVQDRRDRMVLSGAQAIK